MAFVQKGSEGTTYGGQTAAVSLAGTTAGNLAVFTGWWANPNNSTPPVVPSGWSTAIAPTGVATFAGGYWTGAVIYYLPNLAGGTISTTWNTGGGGAWALNGIISEFSGYATVSPLDVTASAGSATASLLGSVTSLTTSNSTDLVIASCAGPQLNTSANIGISAPPNTGYTGIDASQNNQNHAVGSAGYNEVTSVGAQTASWTWTQTGEWQAVLATFKGTSTGTTLSLGSGTYTYTGEAATFASGAVTNFYMLLNSGTYSYVGAMANSDLETALANGTYAYTGSAAAFTATGAPINLALGSGTYVLTGSNAGLNAGSAPILGGGSMMMLFGKRKR